MNLFEPIEKHAQKDPDKTAIVYEGQRISYREFVSRVDELAKTLSGLGLSKGDRVAMLMHNCPEMVFGFYGAMKLGVISVSLNIMFKKDEIDFIIEDADPKVLIVHERFLETAEKLERILENRLKIVILGDKAGSSVQIPESGADAPVQINTVDLAEGDEAVIGYTSGTTGFPKGAAHSHGNVLFHLEQMRNHLGFNESDGKPLGETAKTRLLENNRIPVVSIYSDCHKNFPICGRFFLQPLIPQSHISEYNYEKRYK